MNLKRPFSSLTVDVTLEPEDYMVRNNSEDDSAHGCIPGFGDHGMQYGWNLGIIFLKKVTMIYDFEREKLGFVRAKTDV
jgi:hypothetical protein